MKTKEKRKLSKLLKAIDYLFIADMTIDRPPKFRKRAFRKIAKRMHYLSKVKQLQQDYPNLKADDRNTRDIINMIDSMNLLSITGNLL